MFGFIHDQRSNAGLSPARPLTPKHQAAGLFFAAGLLVFASQPVQADEEDSTASETTAALKKLSLEQLTQVPTVVGASKHEQKITEAPAAVTIVTRDTIQKSGYRTLADLLRDVRGFYVTYDRAYSYIGVRGMNRPGDYGGRVLLTVNGQRMNEPIYDESFNGHDFPIDLDLVDRVEIIRGPGSTLYGNNAFLAVVNVITRRGRDVNGLEVSGSAGSFDAFNGRITYGTETKAGLEVLLSGSFYDSGGHDSLRFLEFGDIHNGEADHLDAEQTAKFFGSISYHDFTLEAAYGRRVKGLPTAAYGAVFDVGPNYVTDQRGYSVLRYGHEFESGWNLQVRVYADLYRYDGYAPFGDPLDPLSIVFNKDQGRATDWGSEFQLSQTFFDRHRVTTGGEFRDALSLEQRNFDVSPYSLYADTRTSQDFFGAFLQDEFSVRTNFVLNAGVRYDYYSAFGSAVNPRAALIYNLFEQTTLKFLYGQAYRSPNAYETDYAAAGYAPSHSLEPEHINSYELVWE
jgi:iron complex outermembrane receptor protein